MGQPMRLFLHAVRRGWRGRYAVELDRRFADRASFLDFLAEHPRLQDRHFLDALTARIRRYGAREPLTGAKIRAGMLSAPPNLRDGLMYGGLTSRARAVMAAIESLLVEAGTKEPVIYAPEAVTSLALRLRGRFSRFIGSEYTENPNTAASLYPIPIMDLQALNLPDATFDIVTTNEVLEHVPSLDGALREIHRILKPGGYHIGTVPFLYTQDDSIVRARLEANQVIHLMPPEYHDNPVDHELGALVFEIPGWNVLARARAIGFREAHIRYMASARYAFVSEDIGGVLLLELRK
ncbi:hypothetical protein AWL63_10920 [Sphingomonas panacis]|uniref:Methyltransferase type 11 domain-containing protein n=1 Tax=Sphingomonas panacis TaxID=1560345 RepID=A0A1B3ZAF2_9SPHN|nr:methyltransferase domain-containing protein [Sphingomonas panacis]AOH84402.1 hypothetical protein AWL63_10920 [Sphingomonas panacis]